MAPFLRVSSLLPALSVAALQRVSRTMPIVFASVSQYGSSVRDHRQWTVVVAMIAMRVVKASIDQIISMVAVGNSLMAAARAMSIRLLVSRGAILCIAPIRILELISTTCSSVRPPSICSRWPWLR